MTYLCGNWHTGQARKKVLTELNQLGVNKTDDDYPYGLTGLFQMRKELEKLLPEEERKRRAEAISEFEQ